MKKEEIRSRIKAQKTLLSDNERKHAAAAVFALLEKTAAFMMADKILMYHSLPDELSTIEFIEKWQDRKHFFLPRVNGVNLDVLPYDKSRLQYGAFHIEEPSGNDIEDIGNIELIVVPALLMIEKGIVSVAEKDIMTDCCQKQKQLKSESDMIFNLSMRLMSISTTSRWIL